MATIRDGGCQCSDIRYRLSDEPLTLYLCHCRECQKQSSSAFGMSLWVRRVGFELRSGALNFWQRSADSGGTVICAFCPNCGSRIYHAESDDAETISIKAGSLDDLSGLRPVGQIWTRSAQAWVPIDQHAGDLSFAREPEDFAPFTAAFSVQEPPITG